MKAILTWLFIGFGTVQSQVPATYSGGARGGDTASSFIVVGDVQIRGFWEMLLFRENNRAAVKALFQKIAGESPAFLLILGDLTYSGGSKSKWEDFDALARPVHDAGIPVYPLPGNHEYFGDEDVFLEEYFSRFPITHGSLWYSVRWKDVGMITLNSNFDKLESKQVVEQGKWYLSEMERMQRDSGIAVIVVSCHHPPYTNSTIVHDDRSVQETFVPAYLATPKAKLFLTGHCHSYEHFRIDGKDFVVSGGGGPRQNLEAPPPNSVKQDLFHGGSRRDHHFCRVSRPGDVLRVEMIGMNDESGGWSVEDEVHVRVR